MLMKELIEELIKNKKKLAIDSVLLSIYLGILLACFYGHFKFRLIAYSLALLIIARIIYCLTKIKYKWRYIPLIIIYILILVSTPPVLRYGMEKVSLGIDNETLKKIELYDEAVNYLKGDILKNEYEFRQIVSPPKSVAFLRKVGVKEVYVRDTWPEKYAQLSKIVFGGRDKQGVVTVEFRVFKDIAMAREFRSIIYKSNDALDSPYYYEYGFIRHIAKCWFAADWSP
jgi:hypothetical protein